MDDPLKLEPFNVTEVDQNRWKCIILRLYYILLSVLCLYHYIILYPSTHVLYVYNLIMCSEFYTLWIT